MIFVAVCFTFIVLRIITALMFEQGVLEHDAGEFYAPMIYSVVLALRQVILDFAVALAATLLWRVLYHATGQMPLGLYAAICPVAAISGLVHMADGFPSYILAWAALILGILASGAGAWIGWHLTLA